MLAEAAAARSHASCRARRPPPRAQECAALGIPGRDVPTEVAALQGELPAILRGAAAGVQAGALDGAARYYADFLAHAQPGGGAAPGASPAPAPDAAAPGGAALPAGLLPALQEVRAAPLGDAAGDAAAALRPPPAAGTPDGAGAADPSIDWGAGASDAPAGSGAEPAPAAVDWEIDAEGAEAGAAGVSPAGAAPAAVDWDVVAEEAGADGDPPTGEAGVELEGGAVDWDIGVAEAGTGDEACAAGGGDGDAEAGGERAHGGGAGGAAEGDASGGAAAAAPEPRGAATRPLLQPVTAQLLRPSAALTRKAAVSVWRRVASHKHSQHIYFLVRSPC